MLANTHPVILFTVHTDVCSQPTITAVVWHVSFVPVLHSGAGRHGRAANPARQRLCPQGPYVHGPSAAVSIAASPAPHACTCYRSIGAGAYVTAARAVRPTSDTDECFATAAATDCDVPCDEKKVSHSEYTIT